MKPIFASHNLPAQSLPRQARGLLIGVTLVAIILRIWGINFGLPYLYHPDEPVVVEIAQRMFKTGDLNPHFLTWPSLIFYLNAIAYVPYYLVGKLVGVFHNPADIPAPIILAMGVGQTPMPTSWLLGRLLTVVCGSASIVLTFEVGRRMTDNVASGLLAAVMMAISPSNVANSRFITSDTFIVFFTLLSFWGSVLIFQQGKVWHYVVAGIAVGLAASAKYNGALIVLPVIAAHFLRCRWQGFKEWRFYLALVLSAVAFFLTTPFALLDYPTFLAGLQYQAQHYSSGHVGMEGNTLRWYLSYLWRVEGPVVLLAVLEILHGIYVRSKETVLLSAFPIAYFALISSVVVRNDRTLLPLTPFLFLLASSLLVGLNRSGIQRSQQTWRIVANALVLLSLSWPLVQTLKNAVQLTTIDSRETARIWIDHNLPAGARVAIESYSPYMDPKRFSIHGFFGLIDHTPNWYVSNDFKYLVFSQGMFRRFYQEPDRYAQQISQYEDLFHEFDELKTFTDGGYEIRIYRIAKR